MNLTDRLITAIVGKCDGLSITAEQALNILAYLRYVEILTRQPAATVPDGDAVYGALDRRAQSYISREAVEDVLIAVRALLAAAANGEQA